MTVKPIVTINIMIDDDDNIYSDTQTHGNSFAQVYRGLIKIREEIDRQIEQRRDCPFNPKYGKGIVE